ncbi:MAG: hypothetical protein A4E32_01618 [Methanomassiliicoccales archaeon PtaU1.Bin124]|nr:MAG: hypothetical protein A4E32_01618 [Methanomassiliicoccales archaeon PtaU1.Bin124]
MNIMATMSQDINLVLQITMLAFLLVAYMSFRKKRMNRHAQLTTVAWAMNVVSFLLVMIPSWSMTQSTILDPPITTFTVASLVHIPIGALGLILSTFLVVRWSLNSGNVQACYGKWLMRTTMVLDRIGVHRGYHLLDHDKLIAVKH